MRQNVASIGQFLPVLEMNAWLWAVAGVAGLVCAGYIGFSAWLFFAQSRLTYVPSHSLWRTPREAGLAYEEVWLETVDHIRLHAWYITTPEPSNRTVLFCHGNAGNIADRVDFAALLTQWGCNVFLFDYRGFGQSQGSPNERGTYADTDAAWRFLTENLGLAPDSIVLFGRSLGAALAAELATRTRPAGLVLESGFTSLPAVGARLYPYFPVKLLARNAYPTLERISGIKVPILIAHSKEDELIPFDHARQLFAAANEPKEFLEMTGTHAEGIWHAGEHYQKVIRTFLLEVTASREKTEDRL